MQEVNLLSEELKPQHLTFTIRQLFIVWGIVVLLLTLISCWQAYANSLLELELVTKQQQLYAAKEEYSSLQHVTKKQADPALILKLKGMQTLQKEQSQLTAVLDDEPMNSGFQAHLTDLARVNMRNLWLSSISLSEGGKRIHLKGFSSTAERVPLFLSMLSEGSAFTGYPFDGLKIQRETESLVSFEVHGPLTGAL